MSDAVTEHIADLLEHPEFTPYGNRIPTAGDVERGVTQSIASSGVVNALRYTFDGEPDTPAVLQSIGESVQADPPLLERLAAAGVVPGAKILIERHGPGLLVSALSASQERIELDHANASQIFVSHDDD